MAKEGKRAAGAASEQTAPAREHKSFRFELESTGDGGEFSGYAAVFGNVDSGNDIIEKGAFSKTIREDFDRIKILALHNDCWLPVGKPIELREDDKGLYIRGKISDTTMGRDVQTLLRDGVLNELSIGYDAVVFDYEADGDNRIRRLKELRLWEVSVVTWAMNSYAKIDEVKSLTEALKLEAKSGKISRAKLDALKPFIAVVRELVEILGPFLEPEAVVEEPATQNNIVRKSAKDSQTQTKSAGMIFEIVPTQNRR